MRPAPTIGMLLPFVRGEYYGAMLNGASGQAAVTGGRIIALQTQDANSYEDPRFKAPHLRYPLARDLIDGYLVTINAVDAETIAALSRTGKPVMLIGFTAEGLDLPMVFSDNGSGLRTAIESLIADGHQRIAFVGCLTAPDIVDRYDVYVSTLTAAGLPIDPELCYSVPENTEAGGAEAAERMIAAGLPSTAAVCGCDLNALGLIKTLTAAGCRVPEDQAVIGFDDIELAAYAKPSLSTVRQYPESLGAVATMLLTGHLRGERQLDRRHAVPTSFIRRRSSGERRLPGTPDAHPRTTGPTPVAELTTAIIPAGEARAGDLYSCAEVLFGVVEAAVADQPQIPESHLRSVLDRLFQTDAMRENPCQIAEILRRHAEQQLVATGRDADQPARQRVEERLHHLLLVMTDEYSRTQQVLSTFLQDMFHTQYCLCMDLLRSHQQQPRQLEWLRSTPFRAACLGVWSAGGSTTDPEPKLDLVSLRVTDEGASRAAGSSPGPALPGFLPVTSFPPAELCDLADPAAQEVVFVAPIKLGAHDWGLMAAVAKARSRFGAGSEIMNHSVAMLAVALDYEQVLTSLREQEERLRQAALFDELTGLPNRSLFLDRLRRVILRSGRQPEYQYGVLFLDIDGFKIVNDSLGHTAGDELLIRIANRVRGALRTCDTAARFGGDEFLVLLDGIDGPSNPVQVAERLQNTLAQPFNVHGQDLFVTVSIGIALGDDRYQYAEDIVRDADLAMYTAKSARRGSHTIFNSAMHAQAVRRLELEAGLRQALERRELEVHFQPIVDLATGRTASAEALVRWRHPSRGLIAPYEFLPVAEESGLIVAMGRQILTDSCRQLRDWQRAGIVDQSVQLSVNVSNKQFWNDDLVAAVDLCLAQTGLPPEALALEITEGVIMHNVERASKLLSALHERGLELHIDDFGTGYSSLEALHQFPIDALKIDRSFVARLGVDRRSAELVRTIVMMSESLGLRVIAEGIETPEHREQLFQLGCRLGQGFWFSRPAPAQEAVQFIIRDYGDGRGTTPHGWD